MALLSFGIGAGTRKERRLQILAKEGIVVKVQLEEGSDELVSGFQCLRGVAKIEKTENCRDGTEWDFVFFRVQIEGIARGVLRNMDKLEKEKIDKFLFPMGNAGNPNSHLAHYFIKPTDKKDVRVVPAADYTFPFEIQLQGENFPSEYYGPYGSIEYKLVAYVGLKGIPIVEACEIPLATRGYINLALDPSLDRSIALLKKRERRFFSSSERNSQHLQVRMILNKRGFVPLEQVTCTLQVDNPLGEQIGKMGVTLVQRIVNCVSPTKKFTVAQIATEEVDCDTPDEKIQWNAQLQIPENLLPTFTNSKCKTLEILYFLQFVVETSGGSLESRSQCKGETMVVIGTVRDESGPKKLEEAAASGSGLGSRRSSSMSFDTISLSKALDDCYWETMSVQSYETAPPAYSSLSSRRPTLDTLPPNYSEIGH